MLMLTPGGCWLPFVTPAICDGNARAAGPLPAVATGAVSSAEAVASPPTKAHHLHLIRRFARTILTLLPKPAGTMKLHLAERQAPSRAVARHRRRL
jgi:hypothetical protein